MNRPLTNAVLAAENETFAATGGVSERNREQGFVPGFLDTETGLVYRSRDAAGRAAAVHRIDGLPDDVVQLRDGFGRVARVKCSIVSGFLRADKFYTRNEAAALLDAA